ncbi:MAG: PAS domain S-box protein [bacterium]
MDSEKPIQKDIERVMSELRSSITQSVDGKLESSLHEVAQAMNSVLRAAPMGIGMVNNRIFGWTNQRVADMTGYSNEELMGKSARILYESEQEFERVGREKYLQINSCGVGTVETRWVSKSGTMIDVLLSSSNINPSEPAAGTIFTALDITERKNAERNAIIQRELSVALAGTMDLKEATHIILDTAIEISGTDCGGLYLAGRNTGALDFVAQKNLPPEFVEKVRHYEKDSPNAQMVMEGKPIYTVYDNILTQTRENLELEQLRAIAIIPVLHGDEVVACLNVASHNLFAIPESSKNALEAIAAQTGSAIFRLNLRKELKESEERYRTIFDGSSQGILAAEIETRTFKYANKSICNLLGYSEKELLSLGVKDLHPKERLAEVIAAFESLANENSFVASDIPCLRKDGSIIFTEISATRMILGDKVFLLGFFVDISERKMAEEALRKSEEKYKALVNITGTGYTILDMEGRVVEANQEYVRLTGHKKLDEILGRKVTEWTAEHDLERNAREVSKCVAEGFVRNLEIDYKDNSGNFTPIEISAACIETEEGMRILTLCHDITKRKLAEAALKESEERNRAIVEAFDGFIYICSQDYIVTYMNQKFIDRTGHNAIGGKCYKAIHDLDEICPWCVNERVFKGETVRWEVLSPKDNRWLYVVNTPIYNLDGTISKQAMILDITERKEAEKELEHYRARLEELVEERTRELKQAQEKLITAERLAALGQFAGSIAHEIRNPLAAISNAAYFLKRKIDTDDEKVASFIDKILNRVDDTSKTIDSIMNLTRMEDARKERADIVEILRAGVTSSLIPGNISLQWRLPEEPVFINADRDQLNIAIKNLLKNSVQAMPGGGILSISAANISENSGNWIEIVISDTGKGIDKENLEQIFQPMFTTKTYGFGFGLSIVKMIVEKHGGTICAGTADGGGASFIIKLPATAEERRQ